MGLMVRLLPAWKSWIGPEFFLIAFIKGPTLFVDFFCLGTDEIRIFY